MTNKNGIIRAALASSLFVLGYLFYSYTQGNFTWFKAVLYVFVWGWCLDFLLRKVKFEAIENQDELSNGSRYRPEIIGGFSTLLKHSVFAGIIVVVATFINILIIRA